MTGVGSDSVQVPFNAVRAKTSPPRASPSRSAHLRRGCHVHHGRRLARPHSRFLDRRQARSHYCPRDRRLGSRRCCSAPTNCWPGRRGGGPGVGGHRRSSTGSASHATELATVAATVAPAIDTAARSLVNERRVCGPGSCRIVSNRSMVFPPPRRQPNRSHRGVNDSNAPAHRRFHERQSITAIAHVGV